MAKEKYKELALKMLELCNNYNSIDVLDALSNLYLAFVEAQFNEPTARILAYSEFIKELNDRISETSANILKETPSNIFKKVEL